MQNVYAYSLTTNKMCEDTEYLLTLPLGKIRGLKFKTIYDHSYLSFEGIPFAEPPIGELRFRAPKPVKPWKDTKNCTKCENKPLQLNPENNKIEGSEDCLYLNVYTKAVIAENPFPVLVFIYGGSFAIGAATRALYGFLSFADPKLKIPGNAGLKDQVIALKWIKEYISHFNGDPKNVTLFGESAGAASAHFLMLSEQGRDLFKRAIIMSGTALNYWANMPQTSMAFRLAKFHGYKGKNSDENVFKYLNQLEPQKLVRHSLLNDDEIRNSYMFAFGPIVEPYKDESCLIPERALDMVNKAWSNKISMMVGGSSFEGLLLYKEFKNNPHMRKRYLNEPELIVPEDVRRNCTAKQNRKIGNILLKLYFDKEKPIDNHIIKFLEIFSYKAFWHDFHRTILARLSFAPAPTFLYRFDFDSPDFNFYRSKYCGKDKVRGVAHADKLSYLFHSNDSRKLLENSNEYKTIKRMIGIWTSYAKTGDPNCDEIKPIIWDAVTRHENLRALNISKELEFKEIPEKEKLHIWAKLYAKPKELCGASSERDYNCGDPISSIL